MGIGDLPRSDGLPNMMVVGDRDVFLLRLPIGDFGPLDHPKVLAVKIRRLKKRGSEAAQHVSNGNRLLAPPPPITWEKSVQ